MGGGAAMEKKTKNEREILHLDTIGSSSLPLKRICSSSSEPDD